ncbi:MAG: hypothetical protein KGJ02_03785 [Verrucomicrobiota bacterium]|nr:hypothetical protein [Verrucomicrobiota bacterium]
MSATVSVSIYRCPECDNFEIHGSRSLFKDLFFKKILQKTENGERELVVNEHHYVLKKGEGFRVDFKDDQFTVTRLSTEKDSPIRLSHKKLHAEIPIAFRVDS